MKTLNTAQAVRNIASLRKFYEDKFLKDYYKKKELLKNDFWEADRKFMSSMFYRGRRDELSFYFNEVGIHLLDEYFGNDRDVIRKKLTNLDLENLADKLGQNASEFDFGKYSKAYNSSFGSEPKEKAEYRLSNEKDQDLLRESLKFISEECKEFDFNIIQYSTKKISTQGIGALYQALIGGIKEVGPKLAGLYLRDLIYVFMPDYPVQKAEYNYLFPVDTWVRQIVRKLEIVDRDQNDQELIAAVVDYCEEENINAMDFNCGAWYMGTQMFDLMFEQGLVNQIERIL